MNLTSRVSLLVGGSLLLTGGCATGTRTEAQGDPIRGGSADYPVYESVSSLVKSTDATIEVKVMDVASRELDDGGDETDSNGFPMAFWNAEVMSVLEPESGLVRGEKIVIGWPDLDKIDIEDRTALAPGQEVVVFAVRRTPVDAPGIDTQKVFYIPLGGDNGVMDVAQNRATARSSLLTGLAEGSTSSERLTIGLDELTNAVATAHLHTA